MHAVHDHRDRPAGLQHRAAALLVFLLASAVARHVLQCLQLREGDPRDNPSVLDTMRDEDAYTLLPAYTAGAAKDTAPLLDAGYHLQMPLQSLDLLSDAAAAASVTEDDTDAMMMDAGQGREGGF